MNEQSYELMVNCAKGAVMGKNALNSMANYVSGEEAKQFLLKAAAEHEAIGKKINEALEAENREPQPLSKMAVWFAEQGIKLKSYDIRNDGEVMTREYPAAEPEAKKWLDKITLLQRSTKKKSLQYFG